MNIGILLETQVLQLLQYSQVLHMRRQEVTGDTVNQRAKTLLSAIAFQRESFLQELHSRGAPAELLTAVLSEEQLRCLITEGDWVSDDERSQMSDEHVGSSAHDGGPEPPLGVALRPCDDSALWDDMEVEELKSSQ